MKKPTMKEKLKETQDVAEAAFKLISDGLDELPRFQVASIKMEMFLKSHRWAFQSLFIILKETGERYDRPLTFPTDEEIADVGLFVAYIMLSQQRKLHKKGGCRVIDFFTEALELFALHENRPFPYLYLMNKLTSASERLKEGE